jgi:hypothetical protein
VAFLFGIAWEVMTVRSRSVLPAMISPYLVDSVGQAFFGVRGADPARMTGFFLLLTLTFSLCAIALTRATYGKRARRV